MDDTARKIALSINKLYAKMYAQPPYDHAQASEDICDQIDDLRDEIGNALGIAGMCSTTEFNEIARTKLPEWMYV